MYCLSPPMTEPPEGKMTLNTSLQKLKNSRKLCRLLLIPDIICTGLKAGLPSISRVISNPTQGLISDHIREKASLIIKDELRLG